MDKDKKQNYSSRTGNTKTSNQTTDSNRQKSSSSDIQTNKNWPRNSRRRENPSTSARNNNSNNNNNSKQQQSAKVRPNVDKRPRARGYNGYNNNGGGGGSYRGSNDNHFTSGTGLGYGEPTFYDSSFLGAGVERFELNDELNSVYSPGSKKQNLNHLLNFYYTPREVDYYDGVGGGGGNGGSGNGYNQRHGYVKKHKYNKEQFLQANFQFVIKASAKRKTDDSPDTLIDWSLIEQINIQTPDEPQCPICLYPPVAAKVTRCGHVYCWPCVLHYLSLSDKTWRKCPICYDAIHVGDLKSASIVQQQAFNANSHITFRLMRRKKGSLFIEQYDGDKNEEIIEKYPYVSSPLKEKLFSKFILAKRSDVADILTREQRELLTDVDEFCPEYVFIQQALELLKERTELLGDIIEQKEEEKYKSESAEILAADSEEKVKFEETAQEVLLNDNINEQAEDLASNDLNETKEAPETNNEALNKQEINAEEETSESSSNTDTISYTQTQKSSSTKFYYFYQSEDGQNIYLHPLNVKMLQACYGSLADAPPVIRARIIQKEQHSMDEDHRRKFTCLGHLPLTCEFAVVEIELQPPYVTDDIIQAFKGDILFRKKERQRRAREEREREKHINAINDRQMGKLVASTANINITSSHEFPTCGFEESLVPSGDLDVSDNVPSTSKGGRTKTVSTSSAGSCSYSAIAIHCKKEHTPWSNLNAAQLKPSLTTTAGNQLTDDGETSILSTIQTNLGDVLAQALSQKKERKSATKGNEANNSNNANSTGGGGGNKKSKKSKKMLPLYSTGMNFSGN